MFPLVCLLLYLVHVVYVFIYCLFNKDINPLLLRGFSVYISNSTNKEDGVLCFRDSHFTEATIPNPLNVTCPIHGRYVIYYNNRTPPWLPKGYYRSAFIRLCEVEVYGKKPDIS